MIMKMIINNNNNDSNNDSNNNNIQCHYYLMIMIMMSITTYYIIMMMIKYYCNHSMTVTFQTEEDGVRLDQLDKGVLHLYSNNIGNKRTKYKRKALIHYTYQM